MAKKQRYYVVWKGVDPGVYDSWTDCQLQIKGVQGALYKSFDTREQAEEAFAASAFHYIGGHAAGGGHKEKSLPLSERRIPEDFDTNCLCVDAACSGNPGPMEYRGVYLMNGQQVFHFGPVHGTNNIGEFLAIVHALALMKQKGIRMTVYSDSRNALGWVKQKKCKTKLERTARTEELLRMIERAEHWLKTHDYSDIPLKKWETEKWGEVPADFGRK